VVSELVIDLFAGGGGTSTGIAWALGRDPDIAINHSLTAVAMHAANHPASKHYCESVYKVAPLEATQGRPVGLLWLSPDCTHHSKAKGGRPRSKKLRGLAWVAVRWAHDVRPRVIILENVEEFADWGPLGADERPCPRQRGKTFRAFVRKLEGYGYRVEHRLLVAADYGAPTTRRRLFLIARCDGMPIEWPDPTHGRGRAHAWRSAAEIIDWSLPCPSIFERRKPLAEATLRRIAEGVRRYVLGAAKPFIVPVAHPRDARVHSIDEPLRTITCAPRGELAIIAPTLVQSGYGEREGQTPRALDLGSPLGTVVAGSQKHRLVAAFLTKHYGSPPERFRAVGSELHAPVSTITVRDHHAVTAAFLTKFYGTSTGADVRAPLPTVTAGGGRGGGHLAEVRVLLERFSPSQRQLSEAATVRLDGVEYVIADIGARMLQPHELFAAQGFPSDYIIAPELDGAPITKTAQISLCGNSVCPQVACAIVAANMRAPAAPR
jgi:DNA (cytosine-5)-methyltransferase 1